MSTRKLPAVFIEKMKDLLGGEYAAFAESYEEPRAYGLRVNTLKLSGDAFFEKSPLTLSELSWSPEGYY